MGTVVLVLVTLCYLFTCLFLIVVVLMQEGKGGGLSGLGSGGASPLSETLGAHAAESTLRKWTKWSAVAFMVLAIFLTIMGPYLLRGSAPLVDQLSDQPPAPAEEATPGAPSAPTMPAAPAVPPAPAAPEEPTVPAAAAGATTGGR